MLLFRLELSEKPFYTPLSLIKKYQEWTPTTPQKVYDSAGLFFKLYDPNIGDFIISYISKTLPENEATDASLYTISDLKNAFFF